MAVVTRYNPAAVCRVAQLPARYQVDLRLGWLFDVNGQRFEISVDAYNLSNANTIFNVRTGTGLTNIRFANDPSLPVTQIPHVPVADWSAWTAHHPVQRHLLNPHSSILGAVKVLGPRLDSIPTPTAAPRADRRERHGELTGVWRPGRR